MCALRCSRAWCSFGVHGRLRQQSLQEQSLMPRCGSVVQETRNLKGEELGSDPVSCTSKGDTGRPAVPALRDDVGFCVALAWVLLFLWSFWAGSATWWCVLFVFRVRFLVVRLFVAALFLVRFCPLSSPCFMLHSVFVFSGGPVQAGEVLGLSNGFCLLVLVFQQVARQTAKPPGGGYTLGIPGRNLVVPELAVDTPHVCYFKRERCLSTAGTHVRTLVGPLLPSCSSGRTRGRFPLPFFFHRKLQTFSVIQRTD